MKKFLLITIPLVMLVAACALCTVCFASSLPGKRTIKGSGHIVTKEVPLPEFDAISVSRAIRVILTEQGDQIRIDANDNLMEWVVVQAEARKLRITIDPEIKQVRNMKVTVTVPVGNRTLRLLKASSAAEIQGKEVEIKTSALQVKASSAAEIETSVKAQSCEIDASSAATVKATVKAATCDIDASSAEVQASSGSSISVNCTEQLKAQASSGASVRYIGDCKVEASKTSGGSIRQK